MKIFALLCFAESRVIERNGDFTTIMTTQRCLSVANNNSVVVGSGEFHTQLHTIPMFGERPNPRLSGLVGPHQAWRICVCVNQQGQSRRNPKVAVCNGPDVSCWIDVTGKVEQIRVLPPCISPSDKCAKAMPMNISVNNDTVDLD